MFKEIEFDPLQESSPQLHEIIVPDDDQIVGRVTIAAWLKQAGDPVLAGEPVVELETDKVTIEIVSPATGTLLEIDQQVNEAIQVGDCIGKIKPSAGTVDSFSKESASLQHESKPEIGSQFKPHSAKHKIVAERVSSSLRDAAHVTSVFEVDMSRVVVDKHSYRQRGESEPSYTAYFLYAAVAALRDVPEINSRYRKDGLEILSTVNLGVITAVDESDLVAPVLRNAQALSFQEIAEQLRILTDKARSGKLGREDVTDGTLTISNHGVSGSLLAAPIVIYPPQVAILGIGKLLKRPVVVSVGAEERIEARPMVYVTLTIDHRALNGARSNAYMTRFCDVLNNWSSPDSES